MDTLQTEMNATPEYLLRIDAVISELKAIRARRWLDQYPPGHPERPNDPPDYVLEYERQNPQGRRIPGGVTLPPSATPAPPPAG